MGKGAYRARDGAGRNIFACRRQPVFIAGKFCIKTSQFQPECGGFGMYSDYIHVGVPSLMGSGVQAGLSPWLALPCRLAWAMQ